MVESKWRSDPIYESNNNNPILQELKKIRTKLTSIDVNKSSENHSIDL